MDGLYEFNIKSPMGNIKALIKIITKGNSFNGYIDVMGKRNEFSNGIIKNNNLYISGNIAAGMMNINYSISGFVQGNILNLSAQTNMGNFNLQGKRIQ